MFAKYRTYAFVVLTLVIVLAPGVGYANGEDGSDAASLPQAAQLFERARLMTGGERMNGLADAALVMNDVMRGDFDSDADKSAAMLLFAEIMFASGEFDDARSQFQKSAEKGKKTPFADDAAFGAVMALEAQGRYVDADKAWRNWTKDYSDSPLLGEVLLAQGWNAMRRDSLRQAAGYLADMHARYPHMQGSDRGALAQGALAYFSGHPDEALEVLDAKRNDLAGMYLRAMSLEASGQMLEAAGHYQKVSQRYPHSPLSDYARLAKADVFLRNKGYRSAAEEFARLSVEAGVTEVAMEAHLRGAVCVFLDGDMEQGEQILREVASMHAGTDVAARAQIILGETMIARGDYQQAILELNRVLSAYFDHEIAAIAQYRVGRCLDALERHNEATSSYQMVVSGYPLSPQAPAAAYLAGTGLLDQNNPQAAIPYFQLVLDRYSETRDETVIFASAERQELVEASLCLLFYSYHQTGNTGQLSGVPHLMLQRMPPSTSPWRAYAMLIDADALAAQARYDESQEILAQLLEDFPEHEAALSANRLLAWTYAKQGDDELAIATEERMLARYAGSDGDHLRDAYLNKAHILFNRKQYKEAAATYDDYLNRFPDHPARLTALYQAGVCHQRLDNTGDAVDRWEQLVAIDPSAEVAEKAWVRAGDLYFQAEHYENAKRCYAGLLQYFADSNGASVGMLRMAQSDYNAGRDAEALESYSEVIARFPDSGVAAEAERGMERALYRLGQRADGEDVLAELVEKYPNSSFAADAQFEIAMRRYENGQFLEAADAFRRVISQFPTYSSADRAHYLMADSYSSGGSSEEAARAFEQFLVFFPDSELGATAHFRVGSIYFDNEDYMRAAIEFVAVLGAGAEADVEGASMFNLALCKRMVNENQAAMDLLLEYRERFPDDERKPHVAYYIGDINELNGNLEDAVTEYRIALKEKNTGLDSELFYRVGTCYEQLGDDEAALKYYRNGGYIKQKDDPYRLSSVARAAAMYEKQGDISNAISAYRDLMKNADDPELVVAAEARANQLEAAGK